MSEMSEGVVRIPLTLLSARPSTDGRADVHMIAYFSTNIPIERFATISWKVSWRT